MSLWDFAYRQNKNLPTTGYKHAFTKHEIDEFIKCKNDVIYFIEKYVKITTIDHGLVPFKLYDCQKKVINSYHKERKTILLSGRQIGKSTLTAAYITHWLIFNSDKTGAILANKASTSREILGRVQLAYEHLPMFLKKGITGWNRGSIELDGNMKLIAASTSATSVRGLTLSMVFLDEFAHVGNNVAEDFWTSTWPTISSGKTSKVIICSTPCGYNLFHKIWNEAEQGLNGFNPVVVEWDEIPGRDEKWKQEQLSVLGVDKFAQEFLHEFLGSTNTLIHAKYIKAMSADKPIFQSDGVTIYQKPIKHDPLIPSSINHIYLIVADPSEGSGNDDHAATVFDITEYPIKIVAKFQDNKLSHLLLPTVLEKLGKTYNNAHILIETNNNGRAVIDGLFSDCEYENVVSFGVKADDLGLKTTKQVKRSGCSLFKDMIENQKLIVNDVDLISQISTFVAKKGSWAADNTKGAKDDLVMTCVLLGYFSTTQEYKDITNITLQSALQKQNRKAIEDDHLPFDFIVDDGLGRDFGEASRDEEERFTRWLMQ